MDTQLLITKVVVFFPIFLFSICFHEMAHGYVAKWKGDNTAHMMGRLTLNPFAHADLMGTVLFPIMGLLTGFFFGWAKPVPINERNLKNPKNDVFWIALAGPMSNIILAVVMALVIGLVKKFFFQFPIERTLTDLGRIFISTNLSLAVFNAIPMHPLDGGKIMARFIPPQWDRWLEENQFMLFIFLMVLLNSPMRFLFILPIEVMYNLLMNLASFIWMI
jgi:Zn-dependent protease